MDSTFAESSGPSATASQVKPQTSGLEGSPPLLLYITECTHSILATSHSWSLLSILGRQIRVRGMHSLLAYLLASLGIMPAKRTSALGRESHLSLCYAKNVRGHLSVQPFPCLLSDPACELCRKAGPLQTGEQRHSFVLDLGAASTAPGSTVYIRLLGPFLARPVFTVLMFSDLTLLRTQLEHDAPSCTTLTLWTGFSRAMQVRPRLTRMLFGLWRMRQCCL